LTRFEHAVLGLRSELGELMSDVKKHLAYGVPLDELRDNMRKELGDLCWFLALYHAESAYHTPHAAWLAAGWPPSRIIMGAAQIAGSIEAVISTRGDSPDVVVYVADSLARIHGFASTYLGCGLEEILRLNLEKLGERFPGGAFTTQAARARGDEVKKPDELEHERTISAGWASAAIERSELLREAREFVLAYIAQCDVPCGIPGAQVLLKRISEHVAEEQT
jgi:hypothetical protein